MIFPLDGGGGGEGFASIIVNYPAGSTCTCTSGSTVLRAKDTNGQWVFTVPRGGTWTVVSTDGDNTKSQDVKITTMAQIVSIVLAYDLYLFNGNAGGDVTELTGGWNIAKSSGASANVTEQSITFKNVATSAYQLKILTQNQIDFGNYRNYNVIKVFCPSLTGTDGVVYFGQTNETGRTSVLSVTRATLSQGENMVPISYDTSYFGFDGAQQPFDVTITKVWMEHVNFTTDTFSIVLNGMFPPGMNLDGIIRTNYPGTMTQQGEYVEFAITTASFGRAYSEKIDVSTYNTLYIDWMYYVAAGKSQAFVGLTETLNNSTIKSVFQYESAGNYNNLRQITTVDISAVTGEYYVGFTATGTSNTTTSIKIYNFWLE